MAYNETGPPRGDPSTGISDQRQTAGRTDRGDVWQKDNEIRQLQKLLDDLVNHDMAT